MGVLRDLINCRVGIYDIDYYNDDEITVIIDELCKNEYVLYSFVFFYFLYIVFYDVILFVFDNLLLYFVYEIEVMMNANWQY